LEGADGVGDPDTPGLRIGMTIDRGCSPDKVNDGRRFGDWCNAAYDLLRYLEPGLNIDVGAAIGRTTRRMLDRNPASRVIAYEPFGGNRTYFDAAIGGDPRVTLRPVAVADHVGIGHFVVPGMIQPGETGWAKEMPGYSPLGHLTREGRNAGVAIDLVTLDEEISEPVRFLKIDVQGGELRVLKGAERLMAGPGIDLLYIEFNGAPAVLRLLRAHGYILFDCAYMAWPTRRYFRNWFRRRRRDWVMPGWPVVEQGVMSSGSKVAYVWPSAPFRSFLPYCAWFFVNRALRSGLQTDLLCVHERFLPTVWRVMETEAG
jgi:FkbM family methyltransferase